MGATHLKRDMELSSALRTELVERLRAAGELTDPRWRRAFAEVPRELFVPVYYTGAVGGHRRLSGGDPDPLGHENWLVGAYADEPLATRVRDGELMSSSSQPSLMARMLSALNVQDGHRVLEIGTGTGYNAALLAHRLGDGNVTTADLDPEITASARDHLTEAGFHPEVVTGDGALGCPWRAPFDRILATCAVSRVPPAWIAQTRPDGLILAPLATGLLALRVTDATHAEGRFLRTPAYFVPLRGGAAAPVPRIRGLPCRLLQSERFRFLLTLTAGALDPADAHAVWRGEGRPGRERFGVSVAGDAQWAWLDHPEGPCRWPLGGARRP
ncbi:methyltransferase domain-containing protein [Streptomyces telluris]|uniref:Protein-L-isoaspartate O-methyltransferase n=1 Tax=Streptomyces telluris TaxID=2720021 RepID=A0A9X2RP64_9ACTN|nr:methyltransferase domain-containing protein [Streptomyces telluris]MCQ8770775.1 methyltransferase domain-containing protein [Streptomyces telluris]